MRISENSCVDRKEKAKGGEQADHVDSGLNENEF